MLQQSLSKILYFEGKSHNINFFISSLTEYNPFYTTVEIEQWLRSINQDQHFNVTAIPLNQMKKWSFNDLTGDLRHDSGGFFSIRGLQVETNWGSVSKWSQPIIYQPEIGILGIITKKINGILYFLLQAKAEPGNINTYQLSPTVQATRSNYKKLHGGKSTLYLKYFSDHPDTEVLIDQLQSEQGARFYHKRNRNIIIRVSNDYKLDVGQNHRWLSLGQILKLANKDNTVNMDTRSVISSISYDPENIKSKAKIDEDALATCLSQFSIISINNIKFGAKLMISSHENSHSLHSFDSILRKIAKRKFECDLNVNLVPLNTIEQWIQTSEKIYHPERKFFSILGVRVKAMDREVPTWDQPIIKQDHKGIVGFIIKEFDGIMHFLTQLKMESGVMDLLEIAPTVQLITSNYEENDMPLFTDELLYRNNSETITDVFQSEEGGRFFRESNQNIILKANKLFHPNKNHNFIWMTLGQLKRLNKFNNYLNVEARSLMTCVAASCYE